MRVVVRLMPPLLLELWRELHPKAHEQTALDFSPVSSPAKPAVLFCSDPICVEQRPTSPCTDTN